MIVTLTLNPAFDIHCKTKEFRLGHESFFHILSADAGGKGINISRALNSFGVKNRAIVVVGTENGNTYCKKLQETSVNYQAVPVEGRIRENYILHDDSEVETRVSFNGFSVDETLFGRVVEAIGKVDADTIVTVTGSNPHGVDVAMVKEFVKELKQKGAKIVIDSRSFSLADIIEVKPYLIKPNKDEIAGYIGRELKNLDEIAPVAEEIRQKGVENVIISAGGEGAVFACREGVFVAEPPEINAVSTIGAGDSTIAGFLAAIVKGEGLTDAFRNAVAAGTAACCEAGTNPPKAELAKQIRQKVKLQKV